MDRLNRLDDVSSLYGPGTVGCWLFTLLSVFVTWTANPRTSKKDTITNDLLATLSLPAIASVHLLYKLRTSSASIREILTSQSQENLQLAAAIEAPLNVCETFSAAAIVLTGISVTMQHKKRALIVLIVGVQGFLPEIVLMIGSFGAEPSVITLARPFIFNLYGVTIVIIVISVCLIAVYLATLLMPDATPTDLPEEDWRNWREPSEPGRARLIGFTSFFFAIASALATALQGTGALVTAVAQDNQQRLLFFIPRTSVSIHDLDQAVALAAGVVTLLFSIYEAAQHVLAEHGRRLALWKDQILESRAEQRRRQATTTVDSRNDPARTTFGMRVLSSSEQSRGSLSQHNNDLRQDLGAR